MVTRFSVDSEQKEIYKILRQVSGALILAGEGWKEPDQLISVRYLLRKTLFTSFCKMVQSAPEGIERCKKSDRKLIDAAMKSGKPVYHECHAGLIDFCFPVTYKGKQIPIIGGQFLFNPLDRELESHIIKKVGCLNIKRERIRGCLYSVPVISHQTIKVLIALLNILFESFSEIQIIDILGKISGKESGQNERIQRLVNFLKENYTRRYSLREIAKNLNTSPYYLEHMFKKEFGISVIAYRNYLRLTAAKDLLKTTDAPITEIAFNLGWNDSNYFSNYFRKKTGISPSAFRKAC